MRKLNIYEALKNVPNKKAEYFKWKFDIRYNRDLPKKTEEEFLRNIQRKSLNPFIKWEKSSEYKQLLAIYLDSQIANDLDEIYKVVSKKAKQGDEKSIKLFLQLQKEIQQHAKNAEKAFVVEDVEEQEDDDDLKV